MRVNAIDIGGNKLYVRHTKTGEQRLANLNQEDCLVLNEHLVILKKKKLYQPNGLLFPSKQGGLVGKNTVLRKIKRACKRLGIEKNITNHSFRHYVVTEILDHTANVEVVKAITGHKDTKTIFEHYTHAKSEMVNKALEITHIDTGLVSKKNSQKVCQKVCQNGVGSEVLPKTTG